MLQPNRKTEVQQSTNPSIDYINGIVLNKDGQLGKFHDIGTYRTFQCVKNHPLSCWISTQIEDITNREVTKNKVDIYLVFLLTELHIY